MATADKARELSEHPVWIRGIDHRIEIHQPGMRDLRGLDVDRARRQGRRRRRRAGRPRRAVGRRSRHQEKILREALGPRRRRATSTRPAVPLAANPMMAVGLARIVEAARQIAEGEQAPRRRPRDVGPGAAAEPRLRPGRGLTDEQRNRARSSASARPSTRSAATTCRCRVSCVRPRSARSTTPS